MTDDAGLAARLLAIATHMEALDWSGLVIFKPVEAILREAADALTRPLPEEGETPETDALNAEWCRNASASGHLTAALRHSRSMERQRNAALSELSALKHEVERSYSTLSMYGVSKERAKNVPNGIGVLVTRMDKEIEALKHDIARAVQANTEALAEIKRLRAELVEAWESAVDWAGYAPHYMRAKHGYDDDVKKLEAARKGASE